MKKRSIFCSCLIIYSLFGTLEIGTVDEFTVPKKKGKQSVNALKKSNVEISTELFRRSAVMIQDIGVLQEQLITTIDQVLEHDDRQFHQEQEQALRKALELTQRAQELLVQSRKCLVS